jgi:hypothetical protein
VLSLVHAMLLGADSIDDCDVLRAGATEAVVGHGSARISVYRMTGCRPAGS